MSSLTSWSRETLGSWLVVHLACAARLGLIVDFALGAAWEQKGKHWMQDRTRCGSQGSILSGYDQNGRRRVDDSVSDRVQD